MPTDEALDELLEAAISHSSEGRDVVALELYALYLEYRPANEYTQFFYGECLRVVGRKEAAEQQFLKLLNSPKYGGRKIHTRLGILYCDWGKHDLAETHWAKACNEPDAPGWAWIMRGANLARNGRLEEAEYCHRTAIASHDCDEDEAFLNLGYVLRAQADYAGAESAFQNALELTPDYLEAIEGLQSLAGLAETLELASANLQN